MRQKLGPLFEAMSLNHFPECHEKQSLSGCLCSTVILRKAEASQPQSSMPTDVKTRVSQSVVPQPAASALPGNWLKIQTFTVHPRPTESENPDMAQQFEI